VERAAFAAGQAAVVEDAGDLGVGVVIQELIDGGDGGGGCLAHLGCGRRDRPEYHEAVRLTAVPKGVPAAEMSAAQREQLRALLQVFVGRIPDELAGREAAKFAGDKLRDVYFAWAGGTGQPHYYRLQASWHPTCGQ